MATSFHFSFHFSAFKSLTLVLLLIIGFGIGCFNSPVVVVAAYKENDHVSIIGAGGDVHGDNDDDDLNLFHQDYSPPSPPPPPPHPPSVSCEEDLGGVGSLDTTCKVLNNLELDHDVYIEGNGNLYVLPDVRLNCVSRGCEIVINITGNFSLGENATVFAGTFELVAMNATFGNNSVVNTTGLAGDPPPQTSGAPQGIDGAGGGHGGRGACCNKDTKKLPEDVWGGDGYSWSTLQDPWSYGSSGGTTSKETNYGGRGGGRVRIDIDKYLVMNATVLADGGDGGSKGGGGSGGSIYIKAKKM